jgi:pantothenate kinase type III
MDIGNTNIVLGIVRNDHVLKHWKIGIVKRIRKEAVHEMTVIVTGDLASLFHNESETIQHVEPFLTLKGLIVRFKRNS